jgi:hypothetical protein
MKSINIRCHNGNTQFALQHSDLGVQARLVL